MVPLRRTASLRCSRDRDARCSRAAARETIDRSNLDVDRTNRRLSERDAPAVEVALWRHRLQAFVEGIRALPRAEARAAGRRQRLARVVARVTGDAGLVEIEAARFTGRRP